MQYQNIQNGIIEAPVEIGKIREVYNKMSGIYFLATPLEKKDSSPVFMEIIYKQAPYLLGGCRPVLMASFAEQAGFRNVIREFPDSIFPSEVVAGLK